MTRTAKRLLIAGAAVAVAMLVWNTICVYDVRLQYAEAPDDVARALRGTKIMFLSDIHVRSIGLRENQVLRMAEEIEPDFVLISGDLMPYGGTPDAAVEFFRLLKPTRAGYAILGDAEYKQGSRHCLFCHKPGEWSVRRDLPIRTIRDEVVTLEGPEGKVALWGADAVERPKDLEWATSPPREPGVPVIAMTHFPELAKKYAKAGAALVLAGDTHGGQAIGPRFLYDILLPPERADYLAGRFDVDGAMLWVSRGLGWTVAPIRYGIPPEVIVFDFTDDRLVPMNITAGRHRD